VTMTKAATVPRRTIAISYRTETPCDSVTRNTPFELSPYVSIPGKIPDDLMGASLPAARVAIPFKRDVGFPTAKSIEIRSTKVSGYKSNPLTVAGFESLFLKTKTLRTFASLTSSPNPRATCSHVRLNWTRSASDSAANPGGKSFNVNVASDILGIGVIVGVFVGLGVGVLVGVAVAVGVAVFVDVGVGVFVAVGVGVFVAVGVGVGVFVGVGVGVLVDVAVAVGVSVGVGVGVHTNAAS
jgi:hypothetical protein